MPTAYLDHAASTPMRPDAVAAMVDALERFPANPSGQHAWAREARRALDDARDEVAELLGAEPSEIVFTSGGTEADHLAIRGTIGAVGGVPLCTAVEHHAVLDPVLASGGAEVAVDRFGRIDLGALDAALETDRSVSMVSVALANNEVGSVNDLDAVRGCLDAHRPHHRGGLVLHTDAVAAVAWLDMAEAARPADLISVSGHKVGGPKGIGVLVVRTGTPLAAVQIGGGQERARRGGTPNLAGAVALAAALRQGAADRAATVARVGALRDRLVARIVAAAPTAAETVTAGDRVVNLAHLTVAGVESEPLLFLLDRHGVAASAGSSCSSGALEPSHVAVAMGLGADRVNGTLRLSLGWTTTEAEVDDAADVVVAAIAQLDPTAAAGLTSPSTSGAAR